MSRHYQRVISQTGKRIGADVTYGSGIEITTSCSTTPSFSSSYSMLTSQVPSFDGVGQQLTAHSIQDRNHIAKISRRTGEWDVALVLARVPPL